MNKFVVTTLAALASLGLAGSALAQSNNGGNYNNNPGYNNNQGYNNNNPGNNGNMNGGQAYNGAQGNGYQGYNHSEAYNGNQRYNGNPRYNQAQIDTPSTQVRLTQVLLSSMGLYNGAIDGVNGQDTSQAIAEFQAHHQLRQTGQLDPATLAAVRRTSDMALMEENNGMQNGRAASETQGGENGYGNQNQGGMNNGNMNNGNNGNGNP